MEDGKKPLNKIYKDTLSNLRRLSDFRNVIAHSHFIAEPDESGKTAHILFCYDPTAKGKKDEKHIYRFDKFEEKYLMAVRITREINDIYDDCMEISDDAAFLADVPKAGERPFAVIPGGKSESD